MGALPPAGPPVPTFIRGDSNRDGGVDISDAVGILLYLFGGRDVTCLDAFDVNDSGTVDISDPIALLDFLFAHGTPPPPPFPHRGADPTEDELGCEL